MENEENVIQENAQNPDYTPAETIPNNFQAELDAQMKEIENLKNEIANRDAIIASYKQCSLSAGADAVMENIKKLIR